MTKTQSTGKAGPRTSIYGGIEGHVLCDKCWLNVCGYRNHFRFSNPIPVEKSAGQQQPPNTRHRTTGSEENACKIGRTRVRARHERTGRKETTITRTRRLAFLLFLSAPFSCGRAIVGSTTPRVRFRSTNENINLHICIWFHLYLHLDPRHGIIFSTFG
ncbi:uncharacterized protein LOC27208698 [Drosophila simulans]|uniref:uncharacterized protein LOC27208698 n=1 Tax=Drosophila simulans TaxID=7240 RepID=UPI001D1208E8|nr:uncharacterized protein LOC27208698 [Drosophila simulans]